MSFKIHPLSDGSIELVFENKISLWNILKTISDTPYLQSYLIEDYEGGNTQVPVSQWKKDDVMFHELSKGKYLFAYDSIGFVLDDNIAAVRVSVLDDVIDSSKDTSKIIAVISIEDTDTVKLLIHDQKILYSMAALYLFSTVDLGFDYDVMSALTRSLSTILKDSKVSMEFVEGTLAFTPKSLNFVIKVVDVNNKSLYFQMRYAKRFHKKQIQEKNIKNLSYLKKKWFRNNGYLSYIRDKRENNSLFFFVWNIGIIIVLLGGFFVLLPKIIRVHTTKLIPLYLALLVIWLFYRFLKKKFKKKIVFFYKNRELPASLKKEDKYES